MGEGVGRGDHAARLPVGDPEARRQPLGKVLGAICRPDLGAVALGDDLEQGPLGDGYGDVGRLECGGKSYVVCSRNRHLNLGGLRACAATATISNIRSPCQGKISLDSDGKFCQI
jgi:hypothetical protein